MKQDESSALNILNELKQNKREYTGIKNDKLIRAIINTCKDFLKSWIKIHNFASNYFN